ncbi:major capsid protein [Tortoise microvirus 25]|nr:major capsid protein [Tortoise microvirus 25]
MVINRRLSTMSRKNLFNRVGGLRPRRNRFDLSYRKNFTCDMGELIPVMCDECVPGDTWRIANETVVRMQPLAAPIMHEINVTTHYFFVPYRILWDRWTEFISETQVKGAPIPAIPRFNPGSPVEVQMFTLWDYFGLPISEASAVPSTGDMVMTPIDMPWRAYNKVYDEYYRDQDLETSWWENSANQTNNRVLRRAWTKDYFTASRPFRQKGIAPALPVNVAVQIAAQSGQITNRLFSTSDISLGDNGAIPLLSYINETPSGGAGQFRIRRAYPAGFGQYNVSSIQTPVNLSSTMTNTPTSVTSDSLFGVDVGDVARGVAPRLQANATATTFNVSDLRVAVQRQKWLERNARGGSQRHTEFLRSHFGVSPSDQRLQRPEYIGGTRMPLLINEVLQTSESSQSPQGNMSGHGLSADGQYAGTYHVQEFGIIIGLLSIMPKPGYQDGINRQWLRYLSSDFYFPEYAHLSEQGIYRAEIYSNFTRGQGAIHDDRAVFGYTGQYDEMRVKHDMVCAEMRALQTTAGTLNPFLSYWNLMRKFEVAPNLNKTFIECNPDKRIYLVQNVKGCIVNVYNDLKVARPLPLIAEPGLVDHF